MKNFLNDNNFINSLRVLWNYMQLNQELELCDVIIGCGCNDLTVPVRCAELYKEGMASKILFAGGVGTGTKEKFLKSEAEIYKDIAIDNGVLEEDIIIENKSTNTGDNFKLGVKVLNDNSVKCDSIIVVHHVLSERRTLSTAKAALKNKKILITSPRISFLEFINILKNDADYGQEKIEVLLGDIQRIVVYPQFGWQVENNMPKKVIEAYNYIKNLGFTRYLISKEKISELIKEHGIVKGQEENYFY